MKSKLIFNFEGNISRHLSIIRRSGLHKITNACKHDVTTKVGDFQRTVNATNVDYLVRHAVYKLGNK